MKTAVLYDYIDADDMEIYHIYDLYFASEIDVFLGQLEKYDRVIVYDDVIDIMTNEQILKIITNTKHLNIEKSWTCKLSIATEILILGSVLQSKLLSFRRSELISYGELFPLLDLYKKNYHIDLQLTFDDTRLFSISFTKQYKLYYERNKCGFRSMISACREWMLIWKFGKNMCIKSLPRDIALMIGRAIWFSRYEPVFYKRYEPINISKL